MLLGNRVPHLRCLLVEAGATACLALLRLGIGGLASSGWRTARAGHLAAVPLDRALAELGAGVLLVCAGWLWLVTTCAVIEAWRGASARRRAAGPGFPTPCLPGVPRVVRRVVLVACGVAVAGSIVQPALADTSGSGPDPHPHRSAAAVLDGLPLPDRAVGRRKEPRRPAPATVLVAPGDTLWSIAAAGLPLGAGDARIGRRWHAIYAANRDLVGPDPDLIEPGQLLRLPGKDPS